MTSIEMHSKEQGEIITFYSYKGGTGRTMALSNVACLLAARLKDKGVLMIDWDLEAPGLHRFFFQEKYLPRDVIKKLDNMPGLIDLFLELDKTTSKSESKREEEIAEEVLDRVKLADFIVPTHIPNLSMLKAGQDIEKEEYSEKVTTFNWEGLYYRSPSVIRVFMERLAELYTYILIDSRTGYTDIGGISTMLMPEKLVVVFTPNRQSYTGVTGLIERATKYRRKSDDLRPLLVYPLASRIEFSRDDLRYDWRNGNESLGIIGYQPMFERLFKEVYGLRQCNMNTYFDEVQIQQSPDYAYGEEIAIINEKSRDVFSLSRSYESLTDRIVNSVAPWQRTENEMITKDAQNNSILIVHGDDNGSRNDIATFLLRLGLKPVILQDRAREGHSLIEQFEKFSARARYAIILLTAEDVGPKNEKNHTQGARQNIFLTISYFIGKLGRNRILCLLKGDIQAPSGMQGVLFLRYNDKIEERYLDIGRELIVAGYKISQLSVESQIRMRIKRYGWVDDLPDHRDFMYAAPVQVITSLPSMVDLRSLCPPIYDQAALGAASANAVAAAIEFALMKERKKAFMPSRLFIYYNARAMEGTVNSDSGAQIKNCIRSVASLGVCVEDLWPYDITKFAQRPTQTCYDDAVKFMAVQYQRVIRDLNQIKGCLASGYPFVFGFTVYQSLESQEVAQTGHASMPSPGEQAIGGHAVLVVGYDDSQNWFIVRNSWGTKWGMKGYFTLPYSYILNANLSDSFWTLRVVT